MTERETVSNLLKNFLTEEEKEHYDIFFNLIARMLNSQNGAASQIRSMFRELKGNIDFREMVHDSIVYIFLKREYLLNILENREINSGYLYRLIKNALLTELCKKELLLNVKNPDGDEDFFNIFELIEDDKALESFKEIDESGAVEKYFYFLKEYLTEEQLEALCYYFAKDKGLNYNPFLSHINKTNTKDRRVSRTKKHITKLIKKQYSNKTDYKKDLLIWLKVFEKIWSELCEKRVNNSEQTNSEDYRDQL